LGETKRVYEKDNPDAKIQNFKGLKNRCIIIVDLDAPQKETDNLSLLYVGMSRAVGNLSLILRKASHLYN